MALTMSRRRSRYTARTYRRITLGIVTDGGYRANEWWSRVKRVRNLMRYVWCDVVYGMPDEEFLTHFRVTKQDFPRIVASIGWPSYKTKTKRNQYSTCPELTTLVILRRMASPCRWADLVHMFKKHPSHLSEIFWEGLCRFHNLRKHLMCDSLNSQFIARKADIYSKAVHKKCVVLRRCIGFMDGTVIGISRPSRNDEQNASYNGHKRKHGLKFQTITSPDGLILHAAGPIEGRRHDWALYVRSGIETQLDNVCSVDGIQYYVHADSGYNRRTTIDVPFQGANISSSAKAANIRTAAVRVTVEWTYLEVKQHWTTVDFKRKMRVGEFAVGIVYRSAMLLHNIRSCLYPNAVSQYFNCSPPSLHEYLEHKDE